MPGIEFSGDILPMGQPDNASRTVLDSTVTLTQTLLNRQKNKTLTAAAFTNVDNG